MNKKGAFFTIVALVMFAALSYMYAVKNHYSIEEHTKVIQKRVMTMDSFISDIEHDIRRGLYISSMRSIIGLSEFMVQNGSYIKNITTVFDEIMMHGSINGIPLNITRNATFGNWTEKISKIGDNLGIDTRFENMRIFASQSNPWEVAVSLEGKLTLQDKKNIASWNRTINLTTRISIIDFEDPIYTINTSGKMSNKIMVTNITDFVAGTDASNLIEHANNSWYRASAKAPSFLQRFEGDFSPSPYGIESIVNLKELENIDNTLYDGDESAIDYIYFGNRSGSSCRLNETKDALPWLRLDDGHLADYEANCE